MCGIVHNYKMELVISRQNVIIMWFDSLNMKALSTATELLKGDFRHYTGTQTGPTSCPEVTLATTRDVSCPGVTLATTREQLLPRGDFSHYTGTVAAQG